MTCQNSPLTRVETADQSGKNGDRGLKGLGFIQRFDTDPIFVDTEVRYPSLFFRSRFDEMVVFVGSSSSSGGGGGGARRESAAAAARRDGALGARTRRGMGAARSSLYSKRAGSLFEIFFLMPKVMISQSGVEVVLVFRPF